MKEKHLKMMAVIFAALLVIYFISKPGSRGVNIENLVQTILYGVSENDVRHIEIYKLAGSEKSARMEFARLDEQWHIMTRYQCKAQNRKVEQLIADLIEMTGMVRSEDARHHPSFEITDGMGVHVLLKDQSDRTLANLVFGKAPEDPGHSFVRFAGQDRVYFADKNILSSLGIHGSADTLTVLNAESFVDLQAVSQDKNMLDMAAVVQNGKELLIRKTEKEVEVTRDTVTTTEMKKEWVLARGERELDLDQSEVDSFFRNAASIRATRVVDRIDQRTMGAGNKMRQYGLERPSHYIVFKEPDKPQQNVIFGSATADQSGYFMLVQSDGLLYEVSKTVFDNIFKWVDDLPEKAVK